jgi:hypothetical protein
MTSTSASDNGNLTGIAALFQRGATKKKMEVNKHFDKWFRLGRRMWGTIV